MTASSMVTGQALRVGIVGTGHRARLYTTGVIERGGRIVGLCDVNGERMEVHRRMVEGLGGDAEVFEISRFEEMLDKIDVLVVTTVDATHHQYIIPALAKGVKVLTEKPMTTDVEKCKAILSAVDQYKGDVKVLFNYRYNPVHWKVEEVIASGKIGNVKSVHFEWLLDTVHGADYFRRWHRYKDKSGGLMVHKSSHHFDLVNFWIKAKPKQVFGMGQLGFYGKENGQNSGWGRTYDRARGAEEASDDPFAIHLEDEPSLKALYADTEHVDNYHRDMNVFAEDITIEDDMSVLVRYDSGAVMTYHLTAYSPWEGYRVMFNGDKGRLELEVVESTHRVPQKKGGQEGVTHGEVELPNSGGAKITVQPLWGQREDVPFEVGVGGHGGGDAAMLDEVFLKRGDKERIGVDRLSANEVDGALAMAVGLAANESFKTGKMVDVDELLGVSL